MGKAMVAPVAAGERGGSRSLENALALGSADLTDRKAIFVDGGGRHLGKVMCYSLVAVDTGLLAADEKALMRFGRPRTLAGEVHRLFGMAIAAFQAVIRLETSPFSLRHFQSFRLEFLGRVDGDENLAPDFF